MSEAQSLYQPLDQSTSAVRLVTIQPGEWENEIKCTLAPAMLDDQPSYEALSYVWGNPSIMEGVIINEQPFEATVNLETALRHLRLLSDPRTLWIDAICIDQTNLDERATQVKKMRDIYRRAVRTIVWLGDGDERSKSAFGLLGQIKISGNILNMYSDGEYRSKYVDDVLEVFGTEEKSRRRQVNDLILLACRLWWDRIWVLQEVALATDVVVICGRDFLGWDVFAEAAYIIATAIFSGLIGFPFVTQERLTNISTISSLRLMANGNHPLPISHLVAWNHHLLATDARDIVYGVLGLATDADSSLLDPNYRTDNQLQNVLAALIKHSIRSEETLDFITSGGGITPTNWPSWIPGLGRSPPEEEFVHPETQTTVNTAQPPGSLGLLSEWWLPTEYSKKYLYPSLYDWSRSRLASARMTPVAAISDDFLRLITKGVLVDQIRFNSPVQRFTKKSRLTCSFADLETLMLKIFGNSQSHISAMGPRSIIDVGTRAFEFVRNINDITDLKSSSDKNSMSRLTRSMYMKLRHSTSACINDYVGGGTVVEAYVRTLLADENWIGIMTPDSYRRFWESTDDVELLQWGMALRANGWNRRFFISERKYIGLAHRDA